MIESAEDLLSVWSRVRSIDAETGGLCFAQERRLPNLLESGLIKISSENMIIFLTFWMHTHNDEQDLLHGATGLQMDSGFLEPVYALYLLR